MFIGALIRLRMCHGASKHCTESCTILLQVCSKEFQYWGRTKPL